MKRTVIVILILMVGLQIAAAQSPAREHAERLGRGMNLSFLENWWNGTKAKNYTDFVKPDEAAKREKEFADIAAAGFKTVRIPICFGAWASLDKPYRWTNEDGLKTADVFIKRALESGLNVIVDLHHTEFDGQTAGAASTERLVWLWRELAARYKDTDPEKVLFELRNEPHDIAAEEWRAQAAELIKTVRAIAPKHTLVVGFHDWNSRKALIESAPFADGNIIYTFHYYDPFLFTHQGATWAGEGLADVRDVPFPWTKKVKIEVPASAKGKWVEGLIRDYEADSQSDKMFADLKAAKDWSEKYKAPIFLGEFGSYSRYGALADRCRHAAVVYAALGKLKIPNAWWEWNDGFNMFEKGTTRIAGCMRQAIDGFGR
ncbi:MAG: glycoside hydrolase family 5 protein [Acidobacteria bacterium]|nr:glycoside hydrolase family 5 protein [Acidobacteriota bacterium]